MFTVKKYLSGNNPWNNFNEKKPRSVDADGRNKGNENGKLKKIKNKKII